MKILLTVAILLAGTQAYSQPSANSASNSQTLSGEFTAAKALTAVYGSFDEAKKASSWDVRKLGAFPLAGDGMVRVQILLDAPYEESGVKKHLVITSARHYLPGKTADDFDPNTCHACGVVLGLAVYTQVDQIWKLELRTLNWKELGAWGSPPNSVNLATIGENSHAIVIHQTDMHQGVVSSYFSAYGLFNGQVHPIFSELTEDFSFVDSRCVQNLLDRNSKATKAQARKMCTNPDEKIEFISSASSTPKQTYYDLNLVRTFHGVQGIEPVDVKDSYSFNNSTMKYAHKPASK
jgi:hypothetical protein